MDNHLSVNGEQYAGQGPLNHLAYHLKQHTFLTATNELTGSTQHAYFSLKQALCKLITHDLDAIDPQIALAKGRVEYRQLSIVRPTSNFPYSSIYYTRPGHEISAPEPGIYLRSAFDSDTLRKITGLPFPDGSSLDDEHIVQLAYYNRSYDTVIPTETYRRLHAEAQQHLQHTAWLRKGLDCELIYKGEYLGGGVSKKDLHYFPGGDQNNRPGYVEHHYYPDLHQALEGLLLTDVALFDHFCPDNSTDRLHHYGYILDEKKDIAASVNIISIQDAPDGNPVAGIYLHTEDSMAALGEAAGIDLSPALTFDAELPFLLLAEYSYKDGYKMEMCEDIEMIREGLGRSGGQYSAVTRYELFNGDNFPQIKWATAHYHDDSLSAAMLRLLHTELPLLLDPSDIAASGVRIRESIVREEGGDVLAGLCVVAPQSDSDRAKTICLRLEQGMRHFAEATGLMTDLGKLSNPTGIQQDSTDTFMIPIAVTDSTGTLVPIDENIAFLQSAFGYLPGQQQVPGNALAAADDTESSRAPYQILLQWSSPIQLEIGVTEIFRMPFLDIEDGHTHLLAVDSRSFEPPVDTETLKPYLIGARLIDTQNEQLIAARFFLPADTDSMPAGHYLQYNQDHPQAIRLAQNNKAHTLVEQASSAHLLTLRRSEPSSISRPRRHIPLPDQSRGPRR